MLDWVFSELRRNRCRLGMLGSCHLTKLVKGAASTDTDGVFGINAQETKSNVIQCRSKNRGVTLNVPSRSGKDSIGTLGIQARKHNLLKQLLQCFEEKANLQAPSAIVLVGTVEEVLDDLLSPSIGHLLAGDVVGDDKAGKQEHGSTILSRPEAFIILETLKEFVSVPGCLLSRLWLCQRWCILFQSH